MMFRSFPLHEAIMAHKPDEAIRMIASVQDINAKNDEGLTALQLASMLGETAIVYELMKACAAPYDSSRIKHDNPVVVANAQTIPEELARKNGYFFIEGIIKAYCETRTPIYMGLQLLTVIEHQSFLKLPIIVREYVVYQIELASFLNFVDLVNEYVKCAKRNSIPIYRYDLRMHSAAFWAGYHGNEDLFEKLCDKNVTIYKNACLELMAARKHAFVEKLMQKYSWLKDLLSHTIIKEPDSINKEAAYAYERACDGDFKSFQIVIGNDYLRLWNVIIHAYQNYNYVALYQCILLFNDLEYRIKFFKNSYRLFSANKEIFEFLLIVNKINPYEFFENSLYCKDPLLNSLCSPESYLQYLISRRLANIHSDRFLKLEKIDKNVFQVLLRCLQIRYPQETDINKILAQPQELPMQTRLQRAGANQFSGRLKTILNDAFRKCYLPLDCNRTIKEVSLYGDLSTDIWLKILSLIPKQEYEFVSSRFYFLSRNRVPFTAFFDEKLKKTVASIDRVNLKELSLHRNLKRVHDVQDFLRKLENKEYARIKEEYRRNDTIFGYLVTCSWLCVPSLSISAIYYMIKDLYNGSRFLANQSCANEFEKTKSLEQLCLNYLSKLTTECQSLCDDNMTSTNGIKYSFLAVFVYMVTAGVIAFLLNHDQNDLSEKSLNKKLKENTKLKKFLEQVLGIDLVEKDYDLESIKKRLLHIRDDSLYLLYGSWQERPRLTWDQIIGHNPLPTKEKKSLLIQLSIFQRHSELKLSPQVLEEKKQEVDLPGVEEFAEKPKVRKSFCGSMSCVIL